MSTAARENQGRSSPSSSLPEVLPSSSSTEVGVDAYAFRRDTSPRGSEASGGGGSGSGSAAAAAAAAAGEGWSEEGPVLPAKPSIERKRLLRLVATLALDRLQELDPLDLFKDPVPSGVAGYAETIDFPIDFSTIRRRSQWGLYTSIGEVALEVELLCANAKAFNAPGTVYHTAAMCVIFSFSFFFWGVLLIVDFTFQFHSWETFTPSVFLGCMYEARDYDSLSSLLIVR